ncbi:MAG: endolytic transglycosylase MltG [Nitrospira sp.]|nr:MAG: endolytic transglycosylase MltG [Nitrospira sp.]
MKLRIILGCLLVGTVALGVAAYQTIRWAEGPVIPTEERPSSKVVVIPDGSTFQQVATMLEREGLIKNSSFFIYSGKSQSADRKVRAGEYELNPGMTPAEILAVLVNGHVGPVPVPTIPIGCRDCRLDRSPTRAFKRFARRCIRPILTPCILSPGTMARISFPRR